MCIGSVTSLSAGHLTARAAAPKPSARACRLLQPLSTSLPEQEASLPLLWCFWPLLRHGGSEKDPLTMNPIYRSSTTGLLSLATRASQRSSAAPKTRKLPPHPQSSTVAIPDCLPRWSCPGRSAQWVMLVVHVSRGYRSVHMRQGHRTAQQLLVQQAALQVGRHLSSHPARAQQHVCVADVSFPIHIRY